MHNPFNHNFFKFWQQPDIFLDPFTPHFENFDNIPEEYKPLIYSIGITTILGGIMGGLVAAGLGFPLAAAVAGILIGALLGLVFLALGNLAVAGGSYLCHNDGEDELSFSL